MQVAIRSNEPLQHAYNLAQQLQPRRGTEQLPGPVQGDMPSWFQRAHKVRRYSVPGSDISDRTGLRKTSGKGGHSPFWSFGSAPGIEQHYAAAPNDTY